MDPKSTQYAGFWRRFAAAVLDDTLILILANLLISVSNFYRYIVDSTEVFITSFFFIFLVLLRWSYSAGMESSPLKATIGKLAVGLYVTNMDGGRVTFRQATGRFFGKVLSSLILCIGYIMAAFTPKKQALHDQLSNCLVMRL
ncbi:MAG: RDD family protein [Cytophagales bacterium]|nr:RDD family protein [Cytophagales bacterium]